MLMRGMVAVSASDIGRDVFFKKNHMPFEVSWEICFVALWEVKQRLMVVGWG